MQDYKPQRPRGRGFFFRRRSRKVHSARKITGFPGVNPIAPARSTGLGLASRAVAAMRAVRLPSRVPAGLLVFAGLVWLMPGTIAGLTRLWEAPLSHLRVEGTAMLTPVQVAAAAGLQPGLALGGLDALTIAKRVLSNAWIAGADVRRIFPGRMDVRIRERHPAALVLFDGGATALVNEELIVLERDPPPERAGTQSLPAILAPAADAVAGLRLPDASMLEAISLAGAFKRLLPQVTERIRIDARGAMTWRLLLPGAGRELLLPAREGRAALGKFAEAMPALEAAAPGWRRADLRAADRDGVGWIALAR
jgi:cell division protein FtsQ